MLRINTAQKIARHCRTALPNTSPEWNTMEDRVHLAIKMLFRKDQVLFGMATSERAIAHRLAIYLERALNGTKRMWDVDCDYNRVLFQGRSKMQPFDYIDDALNQFGALAGQRTGSDFGNYLHRLSSYQEEAQKQLAKFWGAEKVLKRKYTTPDIVVHERGCTKVEHNLLVVEIKTEWYKNPVEQLLDLARLSAFTQHKNDTDVPTYKYGLFLDLGRTTKLRAAWLFTYGTEVDEPIRLWTN